MADHRLVADRWVEYVTKDEGDKRIDPTYCAVDSRKHLMYINFYTGELISVARGIRFFLGLITLLLVLMILGVGRNPLF